MSELDKLRFLPDEYKIFAESDTVLKEVSIKLGDVNNEGIIFRGSYYIGLLELNTTTDYFIVEILEVPKDKAVEYMAISSYTEYLRYTGPFNLGVKYKLFPDGSHCPLMEDTPEPNPEKEVTDG